MEVGKGQFSQVVTNQESNHKIAIKKVTLAYSDQLEEEKQLLLHAQLNFYSQSM